MSSLPYRLVVRNRRLISGERALTDEPVSRIPRNSAVPSRFAGT